MVKALLTAGLCLLGLALSHPAHADFKRDYGTGLKALQDGDLERAVNDFQKAIAENPDSAERVRIYGMRFEPYLPHFYLGEARFRAGDCAGALNAWQESERRGIIQGQNGYADLQSNQASCSRAVLDPAQVAAAQQAVDDLRNTVAQMDELKAKMGRDWTDTWQQALDDAARRLGDYQSQLSAAEAASDASAVDTIAASAQGESANLRALWTEASQRLAALERRRDAERAAQQKTRARVELTQAIAAARTELSEPATDQQLQAQAQELNSLADQGSNLASSASLRSVQNLTRSLTSSVRAYRQAVQDKQNQQMAEARRTPPPELRQLAELYFAGRYEQVRQRSAPDSFSEQRARVQALLFRAAASFNAYTLGGDTQPNLLRAAQNDIRAIKRIQSGFSPYLSAFPPKFLTLFENTL
ncbi:MAG: hypothetical protein AB8B96_08085 [Lysobacterales bacterium]